MNDEDDISNSILLSVKKMLGIPPEYEQFDPEIIIHINSVFSILTQLGVGSDEGFSIKDSTASWSDYIPEGKAVEDIKTYMYLKVRLIFDPPQSSAAIDAMKQLASEFEWRINVGVDVEEVNHERR